MIEHFTPQSKSNSQGCSSVTSVISEVSPVKVDKRAVMSAQRDSITLSLDLCTVFSVNQEPSTTSPALILAIPAPRVSMDKNFNIFVQNIGAKSKFRKKSFMEFLNNFSEITPTTSGSYASAMGAKVCDECPKGTFNMYERSHYCTDCPPGRFEGPGLG